MNSITNIIREAVDFYIEIQNEDGGIPYNSEGSPSGAWATSGSFWALSMAASQSVPDEFYKKILNYLYACQNTDGLMSYSVKNDMSCIDATAQFILGAIKLTRPLTVKCKRSIVRSVIGLGDCVQELGWGIIKGFSPSIYSTAITLIALKDALNCEFICQNVDETLLNELILSKTNVLINLQNEDGGWGSNSDDKISKSAPTALAVIAIEKCISDEIEYKWKIIDKAKEFLISIQNSEGEWEDVIEREVGFTVIRQSTPYCLGALALTRSMISDECYQRSLYRILNLFKNGRLFYKDSTVSTWSTRDGLFALCSVRDSIINTTQDLIMIIDYNLQLKEEIRGITESLEFEKNRFEDYCKDTDNIIERKLELKMASIKGRYVFFQVSLTITIFISFILIALIFIKVLNLSKDQILALCAVLCGLWGTLTALIFQKGVD